ncbi:MAG: MFS transporter, partial [Fimbriimonadales bacterium]
MALPASVNDERDDAKVVARTTHTLTASWIVHWLGLFVYALPLKLFLKNHFHLEAGQTAPLLFLASLPFSIKPIFAWVGDSFPIGGYRRRSWTAIGGLLGATFFLSLLVGIDSPKFYVSCLILASAGYVFVSCSLGGLLVEFGSRNGVLGALSSYRAAINQGVNVAVGPLAGFLASVWIGWTWCVCAACAIGNGLLVFGCADRKYEAPKVKPGGLIVGQLRALLASRSYLFALAATVLITIAPGFGTPLTYYQQDVLKISETQIGTLTMFNGIGGLTMGLLCVGLAKRLSLGRLFLIAVVLNAVGTLAYTQYSGFGRASIIEPIGGFVSAGTTVAIFTMAGHAIPKGVEGLGYSLLMAANNLVLGFGDMFGSKLTSDYHVPFWKLVLLNSGTTLLALAILPFMPKTLRTIRDVAHLPP